MKETTNNNHSPARAVVTRMREGLGSRTNFSATTTRRNGDGTFPHGLPGQWRMVPSGNLAMRAFEVNEEERKRFHLLSRTAPLGQEPIEEVRKIGTSIFDAAYGGEEKQFQA